MKHLQPTRFHTRLSATSLEAHTHIGTNVLEDLLRRGNIDPAACRIRVVCADPALIVAERSDRVLATVAAVPQERGAYELMPHAETLKAHAQAACDNCITYR